MPWTAEVGHWYSMPEHWPVNATTVWCRPWSWYAAPFKAAWDSAAGEFTTVSGAQVIPWWAIWRWMLV
jgi:hypothetical protein